MSKRTALLTKQGKKYVLFLFDENEKQYKSITIQSEDDEIVTFTLKNRLGLAIEDATYSMVTKGSSLVEQLDDDGKGHKFEYMVEEETPFDTANEEDQLVELQRKNYTLTLERDNYKLRCARIMSTTERLLASPVCKLLHDLQGQTVVWLLGAKFVECLHYAHNANICHRDVRPSNMGFVPLSESTDDTEVLLFDWASAVGVGSRVQFTGTVHYAPIGVLDSLKTRTDPVPAPAHDLESLVFAIWDVTRQPTSRPAALSVVGSLNSGNSQKYVTQVQEAWSQDIEHYPALAELLVDARKCNYEELVRKMKLKG